MFLAAAACMHSVRTVSAWLWRLVGWQQRGAGGGGLVLGGRGGAGGG